jgi:hypothetical protein
MTRRVSDLRIRGLERVTGIEPALSAWESDRSGPISPLTRRLGVQGVAAIVRWLPWLIAR